MLRHIAILVAERHGSAAHGATPGLRIQGRRLHTIDFMIKRMAPSSREMPHPARALSRAMPSRQRMLRVKLYFQIRIPGHS
jgi:hypothetical protein